jgi:hypothetical protein
MHFDGTWKLVKYTTGEMLLFNLIEDPSEQHNRIDDPDCQAIYRRLDMGLTQEMLRSITDSHHEKRVAYSALYDEEAFGQEGWQRTYPQPFQDR